MTCIGVPTVLRDSKIAPSLIVQDYIATHFRNEKPTAQRYKPKGLDSCFGNFPPGYKHPDKWDGNPTQRRRDPQRNFYVFTSGSSISSTRRNNASKGFPQVIHGRGVGGISRPTSSAGKCRLSSCLHDARNAVQPAVQTTTVEAPATSPNGVRPKSASAVNLRGSSHLQTTLRQGGITYVGQREYNAVSVARKSEKTARPSSAALSSLQERRETKKHKEDLLPPNQEELEATRNYFLKKGKFFIRPSKLMACLEVAKNMNCRPLSAPAFTRRRQPAAPPKAGAWRRRPIAATLFRKYYIRGDLPISVDHRADGIAIRWKIRPANLDFHAYLPIFVDGVREVEDPFRFLAVQGTLDLMESSPDKILPVIPQLILPIKIALNTREPRIICPVLKILQQMILLSPVTGQALVPYYRQLLPILNLFRGKNCNIGDAIDYNQSSRLNIGDLIMETLEVMEQFGGPDAFINIKYMIPTYESCLL